MSSLPDDIEDMVKPGGESGINLRAPTAEQAKRIQEYLSDTDQYPSIESIVRKINAASVDRPTEIKE